jgi:SWI/SNF-related matrix-associated actin-dependent regulator 1 of chromatin subfamily A
MSVDEARAMMTEALTGLDRDALLAERAEAEAQLRAAEATLGITSTAPNGDAAAEQEPDEAAQKTQDVDAPDGAATLDVEELRRAAAAARTADDELARAASEAAERPPSGETLLGSNAGALGTAEAAFARALELQEDLPAAWRRLVGALISATGMAIVIGALGWNVYWLLVPIALIAILTVDLRLAGKAAREASAEAARGLGSVGVEGTDGLDRVRQQRTRMEEAEGRLAIARADRDAAYARFEELAPRRRPSEVEDVIAEYEAERAAQAEAETARAEAEATARAEAEAAARAEAEAQAAARAEAEAEPAVTTPEPAVEAPATPSEWWFGSKEAPAPPPAASAPVRALAERLSAEGREALGRIEAQLAALDRVEVAKRSLEWHEANGSAEPADAPPEQS